MSNPNDAVCEDAIFDLLVLAAIQRAARHRARAHEGVPVWVIRAHLHIPARSRDARRLRARLHVLESRDLLSTGGRSGVVLWSLTEDGQQRLRAARAEGGVSVLPESPQHIAWRQARAAAQERMVEFDRTLGEAVLDTFALLDAGRAGQPAHSDEWFAIGERLQRGCRRIGSASHCLYEWTEPSDDEADLDDRREPGDDRLEPAERDRRRARRVSRRNIALWGESWHGDAVIAQRGRLLIALGQTIRQLRVERDISAEQLAGEAGLTPGRLDSIEGFLHRVARRVRSIRPPLTADQQLRLLQLALNVKLKREGKPAGAIRLALPDRDRSAQDQVRTGAAPEPSDRGGQPSTTAR